MNSKPEDQAEQGKDVDDLIKNYGIPPSDEVKAQLLQALEDERQSYILMQAFRRNGKDMGR